MARLQALENNAKFCARINEFRLAEKYADVTVQCESGNYKCHRLALAAASDVFDVMFGGTGSNFKETNAESITLHGIHADTFEEILRYIYTGDVVINVDNIDGLLQASELYKLTDLNQLCVLFVLKNELTVESTIDILEFARLTNKIDLTKVLIERIVKQLKIFSQNDRFLNISFENFRIILRKWSSSSQELLFHTIARWIGHRQEERLQHSHDLIQMIRFEHLSSAFTKFMFSNVFTLSDITALTQLEMKPASLDNDRSSEPSVARLRNTPHFYVKYEDENLIRVFSINDCQSLNVQCELRGEISLSNPEQSIRMMAGENSIVYCMKYDVRGISQTSQTFCASNSVLMHTPSNLQPPPLMFNDISLCSVRNYVYAYRRNPFENVIRTSPPNSLLFDEEELKRGMYVYNSDVDCWFPVPPMRARLKYCSLVACDSTLYLIGGRDDCDSDNYLKYVQAYDHRAGAWRELPKTYRKNEFVNAPCCVLNGKIFLYGTCNLDSYDPRAGKWEKWDLNAANPYTSIISYRKGLCAINQRTNCTSLLFYDPFSKWSHVTSSNLLTNQVASVGYGDKNIIDAINF